MATKKQPFHPDECQCCGQVIDAETIDKAMEANKVPSCTRIYDGEVCEGLPVSWIDPYYGERWMRGD